MQLLVALARQKHFARAARDCGISQPAFSMRIRNLEDALGIAIVRRGNRFQGFTEEGEIVLARARRLLEDVRALEDSVRSARGDISGTMTLGVIPTALAFAAQLVGRLNAAHPRVLVRVLSMSALQLQQGIEDRAVDAGITYADGVPTDILRLAPLYDERYVIVAPEGMIARDDGHLSWAEAAALPLTLLEPGMQNRRILERHFEELGLSARVIAESNTFTACLGFARNRLAATIVPEILLDEIGAPPATVTRRLGNPDLEKTIALITPYREPDLPAVAALRRMVDSQV